MMLTIAAMPAFNEEKHIAKMIIECKKYVDKILVVDDGSTDSTSDIAEALGAIVIKHSKNMGYAAALKSIFKNVQAMELELMIIIDSDEKHNPDWIPKIINSIKKENYDVVISSWPNVKTNSYKKNPFLLNNSNVFNINTGFMGFSKNFLNQIDISNIETLSINDILFWAEKNNQKIKRLNFKKNEEVNNLNKYDIGVVVPAYNEELLIEDTINGIPKYVKKIYLIDDCSTDRTPEIIKNMTDHRIVSVRHEINKGVGGAIVTGYKLALKDGMDIVAVMAGDNQMDPDQLPCLLTPIIEGKADYTKGNRLISKDFRAGMSKWRFVGNSLLTMITKIGSGYWSVMDPQNGYTAISKQALESMDLDSIYPYYGYCNDILIKLNAFNMRVEDVIMPARYGREKSKIKYSQYIVKVSSMIFKGFLWRLKTKYILLDFHPLVFFYMASMILLPVGVLFSLWILIQKFRHVPVSQNFPLLAVFIVLMGLQFLLFAMHFDMQADRSRVL